jgi:hypothetical protein
VTLAELGDQALGDETELRDILRGKVRGLSEDYIRAATTYPCERAFDVLGLPGARLGTPSRGVGTVTHWPLTLYHGGPRGSGHPVMARNGWAAVAVLAVDLLEHRAHLPPPWSQPIPPELAAMAVRVLADGGVYLID